MVVSSFARVAIWATLALAPATSLGAQAGTPTSIMLVDWERQKKNVLAYVDAMPDSAMTLGDTAAYLPAQAIGHQPSATTSPPT